MNCKDIEAKLIDYLDQRLDAASTEEMQQHLATCAACSREAEELRELFGTMSSGPLETPPSALRESFNMMLQSEINMQATTTIIEVTTDRGENLALHRRLAQAGLASLSRGD